MSFVIIVSPAKKMQVVEGEPHALTRPVFLQDAVALAGRLRELGYEGARKVWDCSDALARPNWERLATMQSDMALEPRSLSAAVAAYVGIQYQYLASQVMSEAELTWLGQHLRIASGMYGVLRPFDGVVPYRLEMQAKLRMGKKANLYQYWGDRLCRQICREGAVGEACQERNTGDACQDGRACHEGEAISNGAVVEATAQDTIRSHFTIVNVASQEYARAVVPYARGLGVKVLTCVFGSVRPSDGKLVQPSTEAKAARGTFVRWCAENEVTDVADLRRFSERGYGLREDLCDADTLVFVRE